MLYYPIALTDFIYFDPADNCVKRTNMASHNVEINEITLEVIKRCDGIRSIEEIANEIKNICQCQIDVGIIKSDIMEVLECLYDYGCISWKILNPFYEKYTFRISEFNIVQVWYDHIKDLSQTNKIFNPYRNNIYFDKNNLLGLLSSNLIKQFEIYKKNKYCGSVLVSNEIKNNIFNIEWLDYVDSFTNIIEIANQLILQFCNSNQIEKPKLIIKALSKYKHMFMHNGYKLLYEASNDIRDEAVFVAMKDIN